MVERRLPWASRALVSPPPKHQTLYDDQPHHDAHDHYHDVVDDDVFEDDDHDDQSDVTQHPTLNDDQWSLATLVMMISLGIMIVMVKMMQSLHTVYVVHTVFNHNDGVCLPV